MIYTEIHGRLPFEGSLPYLAHKIPYKSKKNLKVLNIATNRYLLQQSRIIIRNTTHNFSLFAYHHVIVHRYFYHFFIRFST